MKRGWWWAVVGLGMLAAPALAQAPEPAAGAAKDASKASAVQRLRVRKVTLGIGHRAFPDFYDEVTATLGVPFQVGATNYTATVLRFEPDFTIDMETRTVRSKSNRPDNPAFLIATAEAGAPHDTSWAFLNFPPHFSKKSLLAFKVLRIEFENHAPIVPRVAAAPRPAPAPGAKSDSVGGGSPR